MSLGELPHDILIDILSHLDTARDFAHLSLSCKALHRLIVHDGWRIFVRNCFSSLTVTEPTAGRWDGLAERLTQQSRCWERKEFYPLGWTDRREKGGNFFDGYGSASHPFSPAMDAGLAFGDTYEFVAWGAGEDVVGRFRPLTDSAGAGEKDAWFRLEGKKSGFKPVTGDVTAVKIVKPGGNLGMLIGRASGELQLVSAQGGDAGKCTKSFVLPESTRGAVKSVSWSSIGYADVLSDQTSILAGNRSTLAVFPLDSGAESTVEALDSYSFTSSTLGDASATSFIHSVKSLGDKDNTIACALGADERPLNWLTLTPTGLVPKTLDKNPVHLRPLSDGSKTTIRALETVSSGVGSSRGGNLLLSAWDDGTIRLFDTRTPSSCDVAFRDIFQPDETLSSLLSWGTNHFVAGSNQFPHLKIFDYRWSSGAASTYSYTKAAPCKDIYPIPEPPNDAAYSSMSSESYVVNGNGQSSSSRGRNGYSTHGKYCNHGAGIMCTYHGACQTPYYRPNAVMILRGVSSTTSRARPARVISLAKSSDTADSFYVGLPSSVAEIRTSSAAAGPDAKLAAAPAARKAAEKREWAATSATYSFLETGYGRIDLEGGYPGLGISSYTPKLVQERRGPLLDKKEAARLRRAAGGGDVPWQGRWHRWDERFWQKQHFS